MKIRKKGWTDVPTDGSKDEQRAVFTTFPANSRQSQIIMISFTHFNLKKSCNHAVFCFSVDLSWSVEAERA